MTNYSKAQICAVIVSYNCDAIEPTVESLVTQCARVVIVDNGSEEGYISKVRHIAEQYGVLLIELGTNRGQAAALNVGCDAAEESGLPLILTMDQDSVICDGCIDELLTGLNEGYDSIGPNYLQKNLRNRFTRVKYLITSGNLVKADALRSAGGFTEELFIDSVDFDISLKLRRQGYRIAMARDANMEHSIGDKSEGSAEHAILGHSVSRHYYMARNRRYILRRYFTTDPIFCAKLWVSGLKEGLNYNKEINADEKREARKQGRRDANELLRSVDRLDAKHI